MTARRTILVVDDDPRTVEILRLRLTNDNFDVLVAADGEAALAIARRERPDLVVLDVMLPRIDGMDICHILRVEDESNVPIIMLTARTAEDDRLRGLEYGADDYLIKPFSPRELSARINAVLRRAAPSDPTRRTVFRHGDLVVDLPRVEASRGGEPLPLTPTEFSLLATLIAEPDRAFTRAQLLNRLFGYAYEGLDRTIDVHVANLRKKLESDPARPVYVTTVYGVGYRFGGERGADAGRA
ncbi:MAG: response regulator transcription factor [Thermomicrobiales bacterium]|nr:response regulator transcription factor [Thermomicrobiales bacterium]